MSISTSRQLVLFSSAFALTLSCAPLALAQNDMEKVEIKPEQLAPGVAVLFGAGGNIGVSYGEDGTILIDDQFAPLTGKIQAAVTELGASPVTFLINTHWHGDHTGGNENMGNSGAVIMAHDNVRVRLANKQMLQGDKVSASAKSALPVITYEDGVKLHLNGEEVRAIGLAPAHTDGDSIIHWTKSNVIHMGDTFFFQLSFPFVDLSSGGDVRGVVAAADKALAIADDQTKIIPGHGNVATKADLQAYRDMVAAIIDGVDDAMKSGKSLDEIKAMRLADHYSVNPKGFISADAFVETVFKSIGPKSDN